MFLYLTFLVLEKCQQRNCLAKPSNPSLAVKKSEMESKRETAIVNPKVLYLFCLPSISLLTCNLKSVIFSFSYSQYPNLWSVSNSTISPVSQSGGMSNGLGSQFLRGSTTHYSPLPHSVTTTSSGSPLYDNGTPTDVADSQYDTSVHARLASTWTPVTTPSM